MKSEYDCEVKTGKPIVSYRETIREPLKSIFHSLYLFNLDLNTYIKDSLEELVNLLKFMVILRFFDNFSFLNFLAN